jgi:hypothetical protein
MALRKLSKGYKMCEWGDTVPLVVTVCAEDSHTGKERLATKRVDRCISDIVRALNAGGVRTRSCCCGHGKRMGSIILQDGRTLLIAKPSLVRCTRCGMPIERGQKYRVTKRGRHHDACTSNPTGQGRADCGAYPGPGCSTPNG